MLTQLTVRNFKRFEEVKIELGEVVVFIGPNNSGKSTALQALALWDIGVKKWIEKRGIEKQVPKKRPGVTINRRDLIAIPVPGAKLLWHDLHVRDIVRNNGKQRTNNILIEIVAEGVTAGKQWECGLEFDYANEESLYCRPLSVKGDGTFQRMPVPPEVKTIQLAYLPPMSGLVANETRLDTGAVNVRIGEGRTAEVLRNLCYTLYTEKMDKWDQLVDRMKRLFGVELKEPQYLPERGEITMTYKDFRNIQLDLSSSGRGLQQVLLLLAYQYSNPGSILLLDEPDAHLEILRQREIYKLLSDAAASEGGQIIAASHSEVVLNEAADRDVVIAFVGKPHRIDDRGSQLLKSLKEIGFDQYYQAEQRGWVLYLEGSTDLAILQALAKKLNHPVLDHLNSPFVKYVLNQPKQARYHFYGLREAYPELRGVAIYDHLETDLRSEGDVVELMWKKKEIENYICYPEVLLKYAEAAENPQNGNLGPLFDSAASERRKEVMEACIRDLVPPVALRNRNDPWWHNTKASDDFLDRLFQQYFENLNLPNLMRKTDYHRLAALIPKELIDQEVIEKLDAIYEVADAVEKSRRPDQ